MTKKQPWTNQGAKQGSLLRPSCHNGESAGRSSPGHGSHQRPPERLAMAHFSRKDIEWPSLLPALLLLKHPSTLIRVEVVLPAI